MGFPLQRAEFEFPHISALLGLWKRMRHPCILSPLEFKRLEHRWLRQSHRKCILVETEFHDNHNHYKSKTFTAVSGCPSKLFSRICQDRRPLSRITLIPSWGERYCVFWHVHLPCFVQRSAPRKLWQNSRYFKAKPPRKLYTPLSRSI